MKSTFIYIGLFLAICISMYFMYERSFVTRDFEVVNSEEASVEEELAPEEVVPEEEEMLQAEISEIEE
ncbi:MAG: hypothetical protein V4682_00535 [Patescibacteria group bacterium]